MHLIVAASASCRDDGIHVTLVAHGPETLQLTAIIVSAEDFERRSMSHRFEVKTEKSTLPLTLGLTFTDQARFPILLSVNALGTQGVVATGEAQVEKKRGGETRVTVSLRCVEAGCAQPPAPPPDVRDSGPAEASSDGGSPVVDAGATSPDVAPDVAPPLPSLSCHAPHADEAQCNDNNVCTDDVTIPTACGGTCLYRSVATIGSRDGCCPIGATPQSDSDCSPIDLAPRTCLEIAQLGLGAPSGLYEINVEGNPLIVFCDMSTGPGARDGAGWTRVFRHVISRTQTGQCSDRVQAYFDDDTEALEAQPLDPFAPKYSMLSSLEHFRRGERLEFRLNWPGLAERNVWSQLNNPTRLENVRGYRAISVDVSSNSWGGLERSALHGGGESSFIDGSIDRPHFFYAIGSKRPWDGSFSRSGFPTWEGREGWCEVELWVR
jgi:hypothetical protein